MVWLSLSISIMRDGCDMYILHFNKSNISDTEAVFLDLHLSISDDIVSTKFYAVIFKCCDNLLRSTKLVKCIPNFF